jgi:nicotinate-nucleotide adenylyltransferase
VQESRITPTRPSFHPPITPLPRGLLESIDPTMSGTSPDRRVASVPSPPHDNPAPGGVLLFGGTFDPPHQAHVDLALAARENAMPGAWLVFVPAARSPFKADSPRATDEDRVEMLRLALADAPRCAIWTDELDRSGSTALSAPASPSYWVDTLRRARHSLPPNADLRFLIGSDQAVRFHAWREPAEILALARPMVMLREPHRDRPGFIRAMQEASAMWRTPESIAPWVDSLAEIPFRDLSSTGIRERLRSIGTATASGVNDADPNRRDTSPADLHPAVAAYIHARGLYRRATDQG